MELKDILFINYSGFSEEENINDQLYLLTKDVVAQYFMIIKAINKIETPTYKLQALKKIHNHMFNLIYELLINSKLELFNSCFRLARSVIEDKIMLEFIYNTDEEQAYWFNKWSYIQAFNDSDGTEDKSDLEHGSKLKDNFIKKYEKIYSYDYSYAQVSLGNRYLTMKEIMNDVDKTKTSYSYYKLFSDLSHGTNSRSSLFSYLLSHNPDFNKNTEIGVYTVIKACFDIIYQSLSIFNLDSNLINDFNTKHKTLVDYYVSNNIVTSTSFKSFIQELKIPKVI